MKDAAVAAAERGWHVFPCQPGGKRPLIRDWEGRASADPGHVAWYWPPGANVGIACGPSRLVVVDLDTHGTLPDAWAREPGIKDGRDVLAVLAERHRAQWPLTYTVSTPSGGQHLYLTAPESAHLRNTAGRIGPLIDSRAEGGYVVGAGSVTPAGPYAVTSDQPVAELPGWLWHLLDPPPAYVPPERPRDPVDAGKRLRGLADTVRAAPQGQRNDTLNWAAWQARELVTAGGESAEDVTGALYHAAADAGLTGREITRTIASALGADMGSDP